MGCCWRMEISIYDCNEDIKELIKWLEQDFDDVYVDDEYITTTFNASYGFSVKEWAKQHNLSKYKGVVFNLYCLENEPEECYEVC